MAVDTAIALFFGAWVENLAHRGLLRARSGHHRATRPCVKADIPDAARLQVNHCKGVQTISGEG